MCEMRIRVPEQWRGDYLACSARRGSASASCSRSARRSAGRCSPAFVERVVRLQRAADGAAPCERLPAGRVIGDQRSRSRFRERPRPGCPSRAVGDHRRRRPRVEVDLRDNLDCLPCGLNLSEATARTAAMIGVFNGIGASVPPNAGSFRRIAVRLRENCVGRHSPPSRRVARSRPRTSPTGSPTPCRPRSRSSATASAWPSTAPS